MENAKFDKAKDRLKVALLFFMDALNEEQELMDEVVVILDELMNDMILELARRDGGRPALEVVNTGGECNDLST